ncbi:universal stress protein UspE [Dongshaea marina]|uniref:universal stress protein UspE n=1 Tax=Dongshaea marina TaxID=2047966 RepID=UPI000D3E0FDA|nr:universal stress protein UspE [Dongshaea marina]
MEEYKNILVVIDPFMDDQPALHRAVKLASLLPGIRFKFFLPIYDFSYEITSLISADEHEQMRQQVIEQRSCWLADLLEPLPIDKTQYEVKVVWHYRPFEAIIQEVNDDQHDLVLKNTHQHSLLQKFIFTPTDWHLLRESPCPVLLVKEHDWPKQGAILAAIHCGSHEPFHQELNQQITELTLSLAQTLEATPHLVNAYPGMPMHMMTELPQIEPQQYTEDVKALHLKEMQQHAQKYQLPLSQTHVEEGLPEEVIPELASNLDAELVVLGCQGRTGWAAAIVGNTAEHVVDRIDCDLLVLKLAPQTNS